MSLNKFLPSIKVIAIGIPGTGVDVGRNREGSERVLNTKTKQKINQTKPKNPPRHVEKLNKINKNSVCIMFMFYINYICMIMNKF